MDALTVSAASGMRARMESLELLANNIANQATAGYKADREFYSLYVARQSGSAGGRLATTLPVIERQWTDFSEGALTPTGNPLDLAISGQGFFLAEGPSGLLLTRNGSFRLSPDGQLETKEGYPVLDQSQSPVQVDPSRPVEITADGNVLQEGQLAAQLGLVSVGQPETLAKQAGTYFRMASATARPDTATEARVHQGKLESANFVAAEAAVRLVGVMRQFEMLQRAITIGSEMNRRSVDQVARVGN